MMKFNMPHQLPAYETEKLARAFAAADGLNADVWITVPDVFNQYSYSNGRNMPLWQTYLPKVVEFLQMKTVYDQVFPQSSMPFVPIPQMPLPPSLPDMDAEQASVFRCQALEEAGDASVAKISPQTIRQLAKNHSIKRYTLRHCSMCGTGLNYAIDGEHVSFQSNCGCTRHWNPPEQRSFEDLVDCFNIQSKPETRRRMLEEFINSGEKHTETQSG